MCTTA